MDRNELIKKATREAIYKKLDEVKRITEEIAAISMVNTENYEKAIKLLREVQLEQGIWGTESRILQDAMNKVVNQMKNGGQAAKVSLKDEEE